MPDLQDYIEKPVSHPTTKLKPQIPASKTTNTQVYANLNVSGNDERRNFHKARIDTSAPPKGRKTHILEGLNHITRNNRYTKTKGTGRSGRRTWIKLSFEA